MPSATFYRVLGSVYALVAIALQLACVAGNEWWRAPGPGQNGATVVTKIGLFSMCVDSSTESGSLTVDCHSCQFLTKMLDNDNPFCDNGEGPTNNDIKAKVQGAQALGIITLLGAIAFFSAVLAQVCGKIKTNLVVIVLGLCTCAGAIATFAIVFATWNSSCPKTFCEQLKETGAADSCHASYGPYFEFVIATMVLKSIVMLIIGSRKAEEVKAPTWSAVNDAPAPTPTAAYSVPAQ
eukprot:CAMPEP_0174830712 /NCGR_PEP_ID=MMETSP1114-20130205/2676_1 /TAXON_ID=312471 /ORGANISM="Neobodo designis, Strain CCAP 1951/1" /LENGTH=236 /DNA_ID=CAMNT_0016064515 /DNA_START=35 /DNA_END=745 /DNA_ORIENTATION=-